MTPGAGAPQAKDRRRQRGLGGEQVEGRRAVRELLVAGRRRAREVIVAEGLESSPAVAELLDLAAGSGARVRVVGRASFERICTTSSHQGVVARADPLEEARLADLCASHAGGAAPFLMVLDGVSDPRNLGALLRSADFAGATGVVVPRRRSAHVTATVAKAAAGAIEHLPMSVVSGVPSALEDLGKRGIWRVGLDSEAPTALYELGLAGEPLALVLGAEGEGLGRLTRQRCDVLARIPRAGSTGTLNVSVAGAVAAIEVARRRAAT